MTVKIQSLNTPVLFLTFNRIDTVKKVFEEIRKAKPKQLFIASDGPRENKEGEKNIVEEVRRYILKSVDWDCNVKTLFRDKNLGCKYAVSGAIDWFFENVEQGIILEDDCLPDQSFFRYCEELLEKYKNDKRVMSISGYSYLNNINIKESYYLSRYFECWGWATWKDRWELCDLEFKEYFNLKEQGRLNNYFFNWVEKYIYSKRFEDNLNKKTNSWAYPFTWTHFFHRRIAITPKKNLVKNIGFERNSTHTKEGRVDEKYFNKNSEKIEFPLIHPEINLNRNLVKKYLYKELRRIILKKTLGKLI